MNAVPRDDSVLLVTRLAHLILAIAVAPSVYILTIHPEDTAARFAWPLGPTMSAMFFGSLYLAVVYLYLQITFAKRWHEVAPVLWATFPALVSLGVVTILHWGKFAHGTPRFWVWATAYLVVPPFLLLLILLNRRRDPGTPNADDVEIPRIVRRTALLLAVFVVLVAAGLLVAPTSMAGVWPWPVKPLAAQSLGSLLLSAAVIQFAAARDTRWSSIRLAVQGAIVWMSMLLVSVVRAFEQFDTSRPGTWVFLVFLGLEWVLAVGSYVVIESQRKRSVALVAAAH